MRRLTELQEKDTTGKQIAGRSYRSDRRRGVKMASAHRHAPMSRKAAARRLLALRLSFAALALMIAPHVSPTAQPVAQPSSVHVLEIDGVINSLTERYLARGLAAAAEAQAPAVVLRLNTPGGLESSMRVMTSEILGARVPVIVFVAPPGSRAASAGMFIVIAGHVAAMAPGTNIGAAHPVALGGSTDPTMAEKLVSDAAAHARAIAEARNRNVEWAEQAVRESVSLSATGALGENVIDLIAEDIEALLREVDGRPVETVVGEVVLEVAGLPLSRRPMTIPERILHSITDPNIAYILFTIGVIGLIAELYNPGALFPGITGAISLIVAFVAFGSLPINWAALVLLGLAVVLFVVELNTEGTGILAVGGLVAFVLASLMLYRPFTPTSPTMPDVQVSRWLIAFMSAIIAGFFLLVVRALLRSQRAPVTTGVQGLIGRSGVALSDVDPIGSVRVHGEIWRAEAADDAVRKGEDVQVVAVDGITLRVVGRGRRAVRGNSAGTEDRHAG
jgi:membrane-bound serine protease (ClpP class)